MIKRKNKWFKLFIVCMLLIVSCISNPKKCLLEIVSIDEWNKSTADFIELKCGLSESDANSITAIDTIITIDGELLVGLRDQIDKRLRFRQNLLSMMTASDAYKNINLIKICELYHQNSLIARLYNERREIGRYAFKLNKSGKIKMMSEKREGDIEQTLYPIIFENDLVECINKVDARVLEDLIIYSVLCIDGHGIEYKTLSVQMY